MVLTSAAGAGTCKFVNEFGIVVGASPDFFSALSVWLALRLQTLAHDFSVPLMLSVSSQEALLPEDHVALVEGVGDDHRLFPLS